MGTLVLLPQAATFPPRSKETGLPRRNVVTDEESRQLLTVAEAAQAWLAARRALTVIYDTEGSGPADWTRAHAARDRAEDELERCLVALGERGRP